MPKPLFLKPVDRGWRALQVFNYFEAKEQFMRSKTARSIAYFGLARIYYRTDNPFHHPDSAWKYINLALHTFNLPDNSQGKRLAWYRLSQDTLTELRKSIIEQAFKESARLDLVSGWKQFLSKYGTHHLHDSAQSALYAVAWKVASSDPSAAAVQAFMKEYPEAVQRFAAEDLYQLRRYRESTKGNSLNEYDAFTKAYPESPYVKDAQDSIYRIATRADDENALSGFIERFPSNPHKDEAWRRLFTVASGNRSKESLNAFLQKYPAYPFRNDIIQEQELAEREILIVKTKNGYGVIDYDGTWIIKPEYDKLDLPSDGLYRAEKNGLTGYLDRFGNWLIKPIYEDGGTFRCGSAPVKSTDGWFLVNSKGMRISDRFEEMGEWGDSLIPVKVETKYGYLDPKGRLRINAHFTSASQFQQGLALVESDGLFGFINKYGQVAVPLIWEWAEPFTGLFTRVANKDSYGVINRRGTLVIPCEWDFITPFVNRYALAGKEERCGIIKLLPNAEMLASTDSTIRGFVAVTPIEYDVPVEVETGNPMVDGTYELRKNGKAGILDTSGAVLLDFAFTDLQPGRGPWFPVKRKNKWVLVNKNKKELSNSGSEMITRYENGYARVKRKDMWGVINTEGTLIVPAKYTHAGPVDENKLWTAGSAEQGTRLMNLAGEEKVPGAFTQIRKQGALYILEREKYKSIYSFPLQKLIFTTEE